MSKTQLVAALESHDPQVRAKAVEETFRLNTGLYLLGCLERGVTVYKQQVRAHNLAWALWELAERGRIERPSRIAVIGGGIAGLTVAACLLSRFADTSISLFEEALDLCPLQQGCDTRWLHPHIYEWPARGSRAPGASLPLLNWSEGRASDVARVVLESFAKVADRFDQRNSRLAVVLGAADLQVTACTKFVACKGFTSERMGPFFQRADSVKGRARFDIIIVAVGYGTEDRPDEFPTQSYWNNDRLAQPRLRDLTTPFVVSGFGDGGLIELCRLTIERFRQDTLLYEMFGVELDKAEDELRTILSRETGPVNALDLLTRHEGIVARARERLATRLRKDTRVILHVGGRERAVSSVKTIFEGKSSFLNRMMACLLYRCGAFTVMCDDLKSVVSAYGVPVKNVLCRYGVDSEAHIRKLFSDVDTIQSRLNELRASQPQLARLFWEPGVFPTIE